MGAVTQYLDASVLVALLSVEPSSQRADRFVRANPAGLIISNFGAAEFSSALARRVRTGELTTAEARADLAAFDAWAQRASDQIEITTADIVQATTFLRRLDLTLRTPDAIHIAVAQRLAATLVTFDQRMAESARALGIAVAMP